MNKIEQKCKEILEEAGIDVTSEIDFIVNENVQTFTFESIISIYMKASEESQFVFLSALQKAIEAKEIGVEKFFEGMGQLLLMSHLSEKFED